MKRGQNGFTLIAAIFMLVVVATLVVFIAKARSVQQTTLLYGVQGARAIQAARSGIEWGIHQSIVNDSCVASSSFTSAAFAGFNIVVECDRTTHDEGGPDLIHTFNLKSVASSGSYGSLDYVQRQMQASVSIDPL